jgi:hypothetical protein
MAAQSREPLKALVQGAFGVPLEPDRDPRYGPA